MARAATVLTGVLLGGLAILAMAWSAFPPGPGPLTAVYDAAGAAVRQATTWFRSDPVDGHPDWDAQARMVYGGNPDAGAAAMVRYGCGACHDIPGVTGANGSVGPSLQGLADRAYIAGVLPNEPGGLVRWIVDPTTHSPQTAMPDLGVTDAEARDMAAYLYAIGGG